MAYCQYTDEVLRNICSQVLAKASKNVNDFHTTFEEIEGHIWETKILRPKVILLHALEDDCRMNIS
ncbi:unnamed protein product [Acanthoscelides obtectus]|uniref:Uncharacterized protein n=1 Tax=Acanthoscelides obtectus TaxID=200917 RepID=A0A9P0PMU1_ACAOB|nr:unnamed protein product [Acanthoscelides obtectus]CAK1659183.1 hypothetical protein AOBTE_LOCUS21331 [Acanthoscelides obtectus]